MPVIRFNGKKLDPATIKALVSGTLVNGSKPSVWWNRQSIDFKNSFMDTIRTSMKNGESLTQAITRVVGGTVDGVSVPGIMKTTKGRAGALVATAQNAVANEAALKTFQENNDVIKAVTQVSTLDNRTSDICVAYSGQSWDINTLAPVAELGGSLPFNGGPPRHFNCRSRLRPVTKSFKELGIDHAEIPAGTRASMDGQVPADITFNQFLKGKSKSFQNDLLGPGRANLWRNGDINLTQLVDMRGNPMTLAQLEQKLGMKAIKAVKPKPKSKLVNSWLENDDGSFVQITREAREEIEAHAKRLVKAADQADDAVTKAVKELANEVGASFPDAPVIKDGPDVIEGSLHWRKKDAESTARKIQTYARDRNLTYSEAADQISDSLRYTYVVDEDDYVEGARRVMEKFAELGYKNGKFDAAWFKRPDYRGLNINMISPDGVKMELQFHTAKSFEIKNGINHELYEKFRKLSTAKQKGKEGQLLQAQMKANADTIPFPPNIKELDELAKIYNNPNSLEQSWIFDEAQTRTALRIVDDAAKKFPKGLVEFEDFVDSMVGMADAKLADKLRKAAAKVIAEPARQDAALLLRIEKRIEQGIKPDQARAVIANSKASPAGRVAAEKAVSVAQTAARKEATEAMGQIADINFTTQAEYAAWVKTLRQGMTNKWADDEFMKLVEIGENKVAGNIALKEAAWQVDLGDLGMARQILKDLEPEQMTPAVNTELKKITDMMVKSAANVKKGLDDLMEVLQPTSVQHIEDAIKAASNLAKPTAKMQMENYGLTLTELFEKKVAKKISDFTFKVTDDLKKAGYAPEEIALLDMNYMDEIAVLKNGIFDDAVRANTRKVIEDAKKVIDDAVAKVKAINKASGGVDKMSAVLSDLPLKIRESDMLQKAIKKPYQQALKKATDAKSLVKKAFIEQTKFTADDYTTYSHIIEDAMKDVHKKLGPKQLQAKVTEIEAKIAQAKTGNVNVTSFVDDTTNYDEIVDSVLGTHTKQQLDDAVRLFKLDGNSATARSKLFDTLGNASTERQKIAIKEYVHARVNPKKLPNGMNFNEAVARVVTEHANNTNSIDIMDLMKSLLQGADDSLKTNFEQTIFTRARVKSIDALGVTPEGQATPAVLRIREQLATKGDLQDVPIPKVSPAEELAAVKEWLHSGTLDDVSFNKQYLRHGKSLVASAKGKIREGDRIFGENSWGITPAQWQKWVDDVAPTLTDYDVALINQYTGGMAGTINKGLRQVFEQPKYNGGANAMNKALDKMPKHTGTVFRGTQPRDGWSADFVDAKYEIGKVVTERGFGSSATQESAAFNGPIKFIIKTRGNQGAIIGHIGQYGTQEMEVLFKAGSRFRVVKKQRTGSAGIKVWMEELG